MPMPDVPSISYGTTDNMVFDWQELDRNTTAEKITLVNNWLDKTEEFRITDKAVDTDTPQVLRAWKSNKTKSSISRTSTPSTT